MSLMYNKKLLYLLGTIVFSTSAGCATPLPTPNQACYVEAPNLRGHYEGECLNGNAHGQGKAVGKDMYEGEFVNGILNGKGLYMWMDKAYFAGRFKNGIPQVPHVGCYVDDPRLRGNYSGECRNSKAYGRGKAKGIDLYEGEFINGIINGQGTYVWPNGDRYVGQFEKGKASGRGTMKSTDGFEKSGFWRNGKFVE
ncbi:hypothetical protein [Candidatus Parabeggiatoa sp. HSG14]|uniref:hypothetical protein n=1 Tax=Candidatus Parabeggiatoa sp. HSG14 TaxID=3055593 RepID=UPI0025A90257|nr:hypothetical protein [Thiotrichales bacterium HSG14]